MVKDIGYGLWAIEQAKQIAVFAVHVCMYTAFKHSMRMCSNQECATVCLSVRLCVCVMSVPAQVYGCCGGATGTYRALNDGGRQERKGKGWGGCRRTWCSSQPQTVTGPGGSELSLTSKGPFSVKKPIRELEPGPPFCGQGYIRSTAVSQGCLKLAQVRVFECARKGGPSEIVRVAARGRVNRELHGGTRKAGRQVSGRAGKRAGRRSGRQYAPAIAPRDPILGCLPTPRTSNGNICRFRQPSQEPPSQQSQQPPVNLRNTTAAIVGTITIVVVTKRPPTTQSSNRITKQ